MSLSHSSAEVMRTFQRGLGHGLRTTIELSKVMVPTYVFVTFLRYTPALGWLATAFQPVMHLAGLPGEAAMVLVLGNVLNLYAAIATILSLALAPRDITILAIMLTLSHNLFVESGVSHKTGVPGWLFFSLRLLAGFAAGIVLNLILPGF